MFRESAGFVIFVTMKRTVFLCAVCALALISCNGEKGIKKLSPVKSTQGRKIQIYASPASFVEVDGELVGNSPVKATIVPAAVKVIVKN